MNSNVNELRKLILENLERNLFETAEFLAEKLCCITEYSVDSVYLHCRALSGRGQHRRAISILNQTPAAIKESILSKTKNAPARSEEERAIFEYSFDCRLLAAQCQFDLEEWDECLALLTDSNDFKTGSGNCKEESESSSNDDALVRRSF
eukprot:GCRY01005177.1.p1 GENE.GCRY01005177.1~~GCRY01005177.1.p1  ORF type:complete len:150 (-),score=19.61 GCRY01005177.1:50-499(-)